MKQTNELTEAKKNRILRKIEKYKKELRREKATFGGYHDGGGYRYEIAILYFELGDFKKTSRYLNWFDKNFSGDGRFSYFDLGAAVAKFELGKLKEAKIATIRIIRHNTYLLELINGNNIKDQDKYEWAESEGLEWARDNVEDHFYLLTEGYLDWLSQFMKEDSYRNWYNKLIAIKKLLKGMDVSEERSELLGAARKCIEDWKLEQ